MRSYVQNTFYIVNFQYRLIIAAIIITCSYRRESENGQYKRNIARE